MTIMDLVTVVLIILLHNVAVFCVYWWDKDTARSGDWRISERTLLGLTLLAASPAALAARYWLRHKTRKQPFVSIVNSIAILHLILAPVLITALSAPNWSRQQAERVLALLG